MNRRTSKILLTAAVLVAIAVFAYRVWFQPDFTPADFISAAQLAKPDNRTNVQLLSAACQSVEWRHSKPAGGKDIVEATGQLREGGSPVVVRWEVTIIRNSDSRVSVTNPVFAAVGGHEVRPPADFPAKLVAPGKSKFNSGDLQESIKWVATLQKQLERARQKASQDQNPNEFHEVFSIVSEDFKSIERSEIRWQTKVKGVETNTVMLEEIYPTEDGGIMLVTTSVKNTGLDGVKPGDWIWIRGRITKTSIPSPSQRAWGIAVSVDSTEMLTNKQ